MNNFPQQEWMNQGHARKAERAALIIDKARLTELANAPGLHPALAQAYSNMIRDTDAKLKMFSK